MNNSPNKVSATSNESLAMSVDFLVWKTQEIRNIAQMLSAVDSQAVNQMAVDGIASVAASLARKADSLATEIEEVFKKGE